MKELIFLLVKVGIESGAAKKSPFEHRYINRDYLGALR